MTRAPIGCDDKAAQAYLGCSDDRWTLLKRRKIVKELVRGWFAYADLDAAMELLRTERDQTSATIYKLAPGESEDGDTAKRRKVGSERNRQRRTSEELLRIDGLGG